MSTHISTRPMVKKNPVKTMLLYSAAMAVCVAPPAPSILSQYTVKANVFAEPQIDEELQTGYTVNVFSKSFMSYKEVEPYAKETVVKKSILKGDSEVLSNPALQREFSIIELPVVYGGKLPVAPERDFAYINEREKVKFARSIREISVPVTHGGRLPVGRERI